MALKFLNKKGWHTGSLRNIENVWKAEQKHDAEQKKLDELRKQIQEERERSEFRLLQEQAGLVPKQERLDFLYDSGLAVGKGSSDGFKALETYPKTESEANSSSSKQSSTPGALFEDKPQSANDAWRKLHSDPLLLIRQREQEALARVKNNPIQMAMIRKSVEAKQHKERGEKKEHKKHRRKSLKHDKHSLSEGQSDLEGTTIEEKERSKGSHSSNLKYEKQSSRDRSDSERHMTEREGRRRHHKLKNEKHSSRDRSNSESDVNEREGSRSHHKLKNEKHSCRDRSNLESDVSEREGRGRSHHKLKNEKHSSGRLYSETDTSEREERSERSHHKSNNEKHSTETHHTSTDVSAPAHWRRPQYKPRHTVSKLSEEEKAARLREMQLDAELHEEQRWKRLKKAADSDTKEASQVQTIGGRTFLDTAQKSVYGAEKGGSSTIEESVRRRTYYLQGRSAASGGNAFRR